MKDILLEYFFGNETIKQCRRYLMFEKEFFPKEIDGKNEERYRESIRYTLAFKMIPNTSLLAGLGYYVSGGANPAPIVFAGGMEIVRLLCNYNNRCIGELYERSMEHWIRNELDKNSGQRVDEEGEEWKNEQD